MFHHARQGIDLIQVDQSDTFVGRFRAMGSPCEIIMSGCALTEAGACLRALSSEAWRIERKFSRYRDDNITAAINASSGQPVRVDEETARLIDCVAHLYQISDGLFDATSGCLREVWQFDQGDRVPDAEDIAPYLARIGWDQVIWNAPEITLQPGFELDFGGIGKEYAADRCLAQAANFDIKSTLVNLGGDIATDGPQADGAPWRIGIENTNTGSNREQILLLTRGGVATSGDARKYVEKGAIRYCHVLDPRTGWPVENAPASITTIGSSCTEAGICSTLAMLYGGEAEAFLENTGIDHWIQRRPVGPALAD